MKLEKKLINIKVKDGEETLFFTLQKLKASDIIEYSQSLYESAKNPEQLAALRIKFGAKLIYDFPKDQFVDENEQPIICDEKGIDTLKKHLDYLFIHLAVKFIDFKLGIDICTKGEDGSPLSSSSENGSERAQPKSGTDVLKTRESRKRV